jgi:hypothetical protein
VGVKMCKKKMKIRKKKVEKMIDIDKVDEE